MIGTAFPGTSTPLIVEWAVGPSVASYIYTNPTSAGETVLTAAKGDVPTLGTQVSATAGPGANVSHRSLAYHSDSHYAVAGAGREPRPEKGTEP